MKTGFERAGKGALPCGSLLLAMLFPLSPLALGQAQLLAKPEPAAIRSIGVPG